MGNDTETRVAQLKAESLALDVEAAELKRRRRQERDVLMRSAAHLPQEKSQNVRRTAYRALHLAWREVQASAEYKTAMEASPPARETEEFYEQQVEQSRQSARRLATGHDAYMAAGRAALAAADAELTLGKRTTHAVSGESSYDVFADGQRIGAYEKIRSEGCNEWLADAELEEWGAVNGRHIPQNEVSINEIKRRLRQAG